jgi:D-lactate dehydrogenase
LPADQVDLAAAQRLGLHVANVSEYSPHAIAEHAVASCWPSTARLLRSCPCCAARADFRLDELVGFNLHGKTVGSRAVGALAVLARITASAASCWARSSAQP